MDKVIKKVNGWRGKSFTLVELLVVIGVLGILAGILFLSVAPAEQAKKGRDAQRKSDLSQIRLAVEKYYEDTKRYPVSTSDFMIQSGNWDRPWQPYMVKVPKDPLATNKPYAYIAASDGQSYQIYALLERKNDPQACTGGCGPNGDYSYGVTSPNIALAKIIVAPTPGPTAAPTPAPGGGPSPTPTPTPVLGTGPATYFISHSDTPQFMQLDLNPELPRVGQTQTMTVSVRDTSASQITSVTATLSTDTSSYQNPLTLSSGTNLNGQWSGSWVIQDSLNNVYQVRFNAVNQAGKTSSVSLPFK